MFVSCLHCVIGLSMNDEACPGIMSYSSRLENAVHMQSRIESATRMCRRIASAMDVPARLASDNHVSQV